MTAIVRDGNGCAFSDRAYKSLSAANRAYARLKKRRDPYWVMLLVNVREENGSLIATNVENGQDYGVILQGKEVSA